MTFRPANLVHTDEASLAESTRSDVEDGSPEPGTRSSAGEHPLHTGRVAGSIPAASTTRHDGFGFVYFIFSELTEHIKIGLATDPWRRLDALQTACPEQLGLVGFLRSSNPVALERKWHDRFCHCRVRGEWFRLTDDLWQAISAEACQDWDWLNSLTGYEEIGGPEPRKPQIPVGVPIPKGRGAKLARYKLARGIA